jgi:hypothetical protein
VWHNYYFSVLFVIYFRNSQCPRTVRHSWTLLIFLNEVYLYPKEQKVKPSMSIEKWLDRRHMLHDLGQVAWFLGLGFFLYKMRKSVSTICLVLFRSTWEFPEEGKGSLCSMYWRYLTQVGKNREWRVSPLYLFAQCKYQKVNKYEKERSFKRKHFWSYFFSSASIRTFPRPLTHIVHTLHAHSTNIYSESSEFNWLSHLYSCKSRLHALLSLNFPLLQQRSGSSSFSA